jgi:hypothetical protein
VTDARKKATRRALTAAELKQARDHLNKAIADARDVFKIGRTSAEDFARIGNRYPGAYCVRELWRGSPAKVSELERELQRHAAATHGARVQNRNRGGGPESPDAEHVVYIALFKNCSPEWPAVELLRKDASEPGRGLWTEITPGRTAACAPCAKTGVQSARAVRAGRRGGAGRSPRPASVGRTK